VREDLVDHRRLGEAGDDPHRAMTGGTRYCGSRGGAVGRGAGRVAARLNAPLSGKQRLQSRLALTTSHDTDRLPR